MVYNEVDNTFIAVFIVQLLWQLYITCFGCCVVTEVRNLFMVVSAFVIPIAIAVHIGALIYASYWEKNLEFGVLSGKNYLYYQMPFDLMNIAIIAHIFHWTEAR